MRFKRVLSDKITSLAKKIPAIVLTGARQTGKTTLLKSIFPKHTYVSLDLPSEASLAEQSPETFLEKYPTPLLIDEVQYAPKLFRHLKVIIDKDKNKKGTFILTGSQKFNLMKEVSDSLAGRAALIELETFSVTEIEDEFKTSLSKKTKAYNICRGMYPQLWDDIDFPSADFYRSYISTYIERDVRQILNITSLRDFNRFMKVCASRTGQLINKTDIAKDVGVSSKTINHWLSVLEASNQIVLLEPYYINNGKRVIKSPKLYFNDCGIAAFLLGITADSLLNSRMLGPIWETFIFSELRKTLYAKYPEANLWFYRDQQREVDFLIQYKSKLYLADAKWKEIPENNDFKNLSEVKNLFKDSNNKLEIFSSTFNSFPVASNLYVTSGFEIGNLVL